jgi:phage recombination protein Bet
MTKALTKYGYSQDQIQLIKDNYCKGGTDNELALFLSVCQKTGLDPFMRQIYAIKRGGKMVHQVGIDGFRATAVKTGEYEGQTPPMWCGKDGKWVDVWVEKENPVAARIGIYRKNFREPLYAVARFDAYFQQSNPLWKTMGYHMLSKCCEALALRKAFPTQLSGLYTNDEMGQAENKVVDAEFRVVEPKVGPGKIKKNKPQPQTYDEMDTKTKILQDQMAQVKTMDELDEIALEIKTRDDVDKDSLKVTYRACKDKINEISNV